MNALFSGKVYRWQPNVALVVTLGMISTVTLPMLIAPTTSAEQEPYVGLFAQASRILVPAGTTISVQYDELATTN